MPAAILGTVLAPTLARGDYSFTTYDVPGSASTSVEGINNSGVAVGTYTTPSAAFLPPSHGFILDQNGSLVTYDVANSVYTYGKGINDSGQVVGYYNSVADPTAFHGYIRSAAGAFSYFDVANSFSTQINGLNDNGQMVGSYTDAGGSHGFLRSADGTTTRTINVPGSFSTIVSGINDSGTIVGSYLAANIFGQVAYHGFVLDSSGNFHSLDSALPFSTQTFAEGINNLGQVVGNTIEFGVFSVGFVLNPDLSLQSIVAAPNGLATVIEGINDCNQLVGNYTDYTQETHGFITPSTCPEPGSLALVSVGLLVVAASRRCRHRPILPGKPSAARS